MQQPDLDDYNFKTVCLCCINFKTDDNIFNDVTIDTASLDQQMRDTI